MRRARPSALVRACRAAVTRRLPLLLWRPPPGGARLCVARRTDGGGVKRSLGPGPFSIPRRWWWSAATTPPGRPNAMTAAWAGHRLLPAALPGGVDPPEPPLPPQHPGAAGLHREPRLAGPGAPGGLPRTGLRRRRGQVRRRRPHPGAGRDGGRPVIAEFPIVFECRLLHATDLGVHTQFVGEVLDVQADEAVLGPGACPTSPCCAPCSTPRGSRPTTGRAPPGAGLQRGQGASEKAGAAGATG